jgi:membrane fusion protein, copper/silver efflux system
LVVAAAIAAGCTRHAGEPDSLPVEKGGDVILSAATVEKLGVRTEPAVFGSLPIVVPVVGTIGYDASSIREFYAPTVGWIRKVAVFAPGDSVRPGQLLGELYSPALSTVDEQYMGAIASGDDPLNNPYVRGLRALGLSEDMIRGLREQQRMPGRIPFRAERASVVTAVHVREGAIAAQGQSLFQIASIDPIWLTLAVPESAAKLLVRDAEVRFTTQAHPGREFVGRLSLIYPDLESNTRTVGARVVVPNHDGALKINMFVAATLRNSSADPVVHVPSEALIRAEGGDRVLVAKGGGHFIVQNVVASAVSGGRAVIRSGLSGGEQVVTRAVFLIDSEANLKSGLSRLEGGATPMHEHHH